MRSDESSQGLTRFDWTVLVLSVYVVVELYCGLVLDYPPAVEAATGIADFLICLVFLGDFFWRLKKSDNRWRYVRWNWLDFVSSIPMVGVLRIARAVRIFRLLRLMRSGRVFYSLLNRHHAVSTFQTILALNVIVVLMAAVAMFHLEKTSNPFFQSFADSVWWSAITATTLGFVQDIAPVTPEGKIVSLLLIGAGILLLGTFAGMVADYFIGDEEILERVTAMDVKLDRMEEKLDRLLGGKPGE